MKVSNPNLGLYRSLYWANQGLLHAVRTLNEAEAEAGEGSPSDVLNDKLRRAQAMIEETRSVMNRSLAEFIEPEE